MENIFKCQMPCLMYAFEIHYPKPSSSSYSIFFLWPPNYLIYTLIILPSPLLFPYTEPFITELIESQYGHTNWIHLRVTLTQMHCSPPILPNNFSISYSASLLDFSILLYYRFQSFQTILVSKSSCFKSTKSGTPKPHIKYINQIFMIKTIFMYVTQ